MFLRLSKKTPPIPFKIAFPLAVVMWICVGWVTESLSYITLLNIVVGYVKAKNLPKFFIFKFRYFFFFFFFGFGIIRNRVVFFLY